jgi:LacI family transcriptional regulator
LTAPRLVGVLGDSLGDPYSLRIVEGMSKRFARHGITLIGFAGGFPNAPFFLAEDGSPQLPKTLDAFVVLSETLDDGARQLAAAVARSSVPIVSVGVELPRAASVLVNDEIGVYQAVAHLVKRHNCQRIAFIAGPERSSEAARRLKAYRSALEDLHLPTDPELITRGDYEARSGRDAVLSLRQRGMAQVDAIVTANDLMAIGAIDGVKAAGLRIPEDIKIIGFDDTPEAAFVLPSLTTVRQPIFEQGVAAAELVIGMLADELPQDRTLSSTALVIRHSCGCTGSELPLASGQDRELVDQAFRGMIRQQLAARRRHGEVLRIGESIVRAEGFQELASAVTRVFRLLGRSRFLLCVYAGSKRHVRVVLESRGRDVVYHNQSEPYPTDRLLPAGFLKAGTLSQLLIEPLQVADEHLGFSVMETDDMDPQIHLELRHLLSSALSRIFGARELRRLYTLEKKYAELTRVTE